MAKQAVSVGTTIMVATPHRYKSGGQSTAVIVRKAVDELNEQLTAEGIALTILPGVEIPIDFGIADEIESGNLSTLGNGNYVLVEPPFPDLPAKLIPAIKEVRDRGYGVILAHPERNGVVQKDWMQKSSLQFAKSCVDLGCVIQVTSGSIVGRFGPAAKAVSRAIIEHLDWRIVIASDSHDPKDRTPGYLAEARDMAAKWIGNADAAEAMVTTLPAEIVGV
jgi:protein-tyrosine phosphatase